jgi:DnaK suppressor protein
MQTRASLGGPSSLRSHRSDLGLTVMEATGSESSSGLSASQLSLLRERLESARDELRSRMRHDQSVARQSENLPEPLDAAEQTREQDDAILFTQRDVNLLHDIEDALTKIERGQYGLSEVSGLPLGFRRLQAIPWARTAADEEDESPET